MRGGGPYHQGRGNSAYPHSQYSPPGHSPYHSVRSGWSGQPGQHPYPSHGSPTHGFSPNQSPFPHNNSYNYPPAQHGQYPPAQHYPGPSNHGPPTGSYRGFRGNHYGGLDRRAINTAPTTGYPPAQQGQRGRGPTMFSNLSWTPSSGTRGGRQATEAPRPTWERSSPQANAETSSNAVDADDNPFRPSKDLRVEDEGSRDEKKMPPTAKTESTSTKPKEPKGFSFSLKTKTPLPAMTSKTDSATTTAKASILDPGPKSTSTRDTTTRQSTEDKDRERERHREHERERDRERDRAYYEKDRRPDPYDKSYSSYQDRKYGYRDSRDDRTARESSYYRDREYRD
ncbi:uncharacterized protein EI97DRAFT_357641, partial [Westerdykella ornata]